ncbi:MAG TPA: L-rhamnose mutarotase [Pyrinomonadaceae bacterium]|nr:L-rhamnose mutarotase [Pyrinomonadaceae bacterium]
MFRKAFVTTINPDKHEEYERRHRPIWAELEDTLKNHGVHSYSIYLFPETSQLFGYVEFESIERWEAVANTEVCQRWWKFMAEIMPSNADNSPKWIELKEVFHIFE